MYSDLFSNTGLLETTYFLYYGFGRNCKFYVNQVFLRKHEKDIIRNIAYDLLYITLFLLRMKDFLQED